MNGFEMHVDAAARADMERAEEAARAHVSAVNSARNSAGGRAAMAGPHAHDIHSAGGRATMAGPHAHGIRSAGGRATMAGPHAHAISSAGGKALLGRIISRPGQTAHQQAVAERQRKSRAAKRAAEVKGQ